MIILISLICFHFLVLYAGKLGDEPSWYGYLSVGVLTFLQVALFSYLLFTMEVPQP